MELTCPSKAKINGFLFFQEQILFSPFFLKCAFLDIHLLRSNQFHFLRVSARSVVVYQLVFSLDPEEKQKKQSKNP